MNDETPDQASHIAPRKDRMTLLSPTALLEKTSSFYHGLGFAMFRRFINSTLNGYYVYGKNSGTLYVGAATFYGLLSIIPILSCATFLLGIFQGDMLKAHQQFFKELETIIPVSSHGLLAQIGELTQSHLKNTPLTFLNLALLTWSTVGFFSTLVEGLMKVTGTRESGGTVMSTVRALLTIIALGGVLLFSFELGEKGWITTFVIDLFPSHTYAKDIISSLARWQVFTIAANSMLVTMLYRWLLSTPLFACVEGAVGFIAGFLAIKSFYWIYLHYNGASTTALFGGFAPLVVSILWGYFAITAFFIGACIASLPNQKRILSEIPKIPNSWDEAA